MASKSERTREDLVETALRLFRERGYEKTTMRLIATEAGVSAGNAYYYFAGKDDLVQELYVRIQHDHRDQAAPRVIQGAPLDQNLAAVLHAGVDVMTPYHSFGATLLQTALTSSSSVSPFSPDSQAPRRAAVDLMAHTLRSSAGHSHRTPDERLAHLLWMAYLGVTLHWVTDTTAGQERTRTLIDGAAPLLARMIRLSRLPVARRLTEDVFSLVDRLAAIQPREKDLT